MTGSVSELPVGNRKTGSIFRTKLYICMYVTNKLYIFVNNDCKYSSYECSCKTADDMSFI
jgi:hypothetical protein